MKRLIVFFAAIAAALATPAMAAPEKVAFLADFEQANMPVKLRKGVRIVSPGYQSDKCATIRTQGKYASAVFYLNTPVTVPDGARLAFDYRLVREAGKTAYLGINLHTKGGKDTFSTVAHPKAEWSQAEFQMAKIRTSSGSKVKGNIEPGDVITRISIYGRGENDAGNNTIQTVYVDNVRIYVPADFDPNAAAAARKKANRLNTDAPPANYVQPKPADGAEALLNPPALVWPDDPRAKTWRVEMSQTPEFSGSVLAYDGIDLNFFNGPDKLQEGKWYWRCSGVTEKGKRIEPGKVKAFLVSDRSIPFPVPPMAQILKDMPDHPRLLVTPDTLTEFRARAQRQASEAWEAVKASADQALQRAIPSPDLKPYTEPKSERGTVVMLKDGKYWQSKDISEREFNRASGYARDLAFAYLISGDAKYGDAAAKWIDYLSSLRIDPLKKDRAAHDTVVYAIEFGIKNLALAYDHTYDRLSPELRKRAVEALEFQLEAAIEWVRKDCDLAHRFLNSHGQQCMHMTFTAALAIAKDSERANEWCDWLIRQYVNRVAWLGNDGGYFEGQTYGHKLRYIIEALVPLRTATGLDVFKQPHVFNSGVFWLYGMSLNYWYDHWGDVYSLLMPWGSGPDSYTAAFLAAMSENRYVRWWAETVYASEKHVPLQYLSLTGLKGRAPVDIAQAKAFPDTGVVTAYDRFYDHLAPRIFFRSSPWGSQSHAHSDQNMFVIHADGEILAADVGYYTYYGDRYHREFSRATPAHNTLEIGGKGQPKSGEAQGRIAGFFNAAECVYMRGDAVQAYDGMLDRFDRHIVFLRPDVFLVFDDVKTNVKEPVQWLLNTFQKVDIDPKARTITVPQQHMRLRIEHLMPSVLTYSQNNDRPAPIHEPGKKWSRFTPRFPQAWHTEVEAPAAPERRFLALMSAFDVAKGNPVKDRKKIDSGDAVGAEFDRGDARYTMLIKPNGPKKMDAAGIESDAVAVLTRREGKGAVASWMAAEATEMRVRRVPLLKGPRGSYAAAYDCDGAKALFHVHAEKAGAVSLYLPEKPKQVLIYPAHEANKAKPIEFTWSGKQLALNIPANRELTIQADPVASPSEIPDTATIRVNDGSDWKAELETGVAEDGRWVAFDRVSPKKEGIYRFTCDDPKAEFLVQDRWDIRRSTRGTGPLEALWREGAEVFVHVTPAAKMPSVRAQIVREATEEERNRLRNGGFEEWIPEYPPRGWYIRHARKDAMGWPEWEKKGALEGESCVRLTRPEQLIGIYAQPVKTLRPGKYVFKFATKGEATCGQAEIAFEGSTLDSRQIAPSAEWTRHEIPVEVGKGVVYVRFRMEMGEPENQTLWIDDVRLTPAD